MNWVTSYGAISQVFLREDYQTQKCFADLSGLRRHEQQECGRPFRARKGGRGRVTREHRGSFTAGAKTLGLPLTFWWMIMITWLAFVQNWLHSGKSTCQILPEKSLEPTCPSETMLLASLECLLPLDTWAVLISLHRLGGYSNLFCIKRHFFFYMLLPLTAIASSSSLFS